MLAPVARAEPLPKAAYADPSVFALERVQLFDRAWLAVCHGSEVEAPGHSESRRFSIRLTLW